MLDSYWFWAFVILFSFFLDVIIVNSKRIGSTPLFGIIFVTLPFVSRLIIVLPFIEPPRFSISNLVAVTIGIPVLIFGFFFALAPVSHLGILSPFTRPEQNEKLQTGGFYRMLRHPIL